MMIKYRNEIPNANDYWLRYLSSGWNAVYNLDETVLKAIVRNYPSIMKVENGIVTEKRMLNH